MGEGLRPPRLSQDNFEPLCPTTDSSCSEAGSSYSITTDNVSSFEMLPQTTNVHERLIQEKLVQYPEQERYVKWGIAWKTPMLMALWTVFGLSCAIGHHFYYRSLHGSKVGSSFKQSWSLGFGTAFTFLVIASLRATCDAAYKQYIWTLFKRKAFSLGVIDKIFSVTSDPISFFSWEILRHAKVALFVAAICW